MLGVVLTVVVAKYLIGRPRIEVVVPKIQEVGVRTRVIRVIDGDTVMVDDVGTQRSVRLIGMDSPEMKDTNNDDQCFAREASQRARELLADKQVMLVDDKTQGDKDMYGRLLRNIFLDDGSNFAERMISEGFAREYTFKVPYKYQGIFQQVENVAKEKAMGLWGFCKSN